MPLRVFLADDVEGVRALWRFLLEEDPDLVIVGEAGDGNAAIEGIAATSPDVVLLDISMPGLDGLEVLQHLRAQDPDVPAVVVASAFAAGRLAERSLELGAAAYFEKGCPPAELVETVKTASRLLHPRCA